MAYGGQEDGTDRLLAATAILLLMSASSSPASAAVIDRNQPIDAQVENHREARDAYSQELYREETALQDNVRALE
jgi:lipopolysaccharide export system protein LptA